MKQKLHDFFQMLADKIGPQRGDSSGPPFYAVYCDYTNQDIILTAINGLLQHRCEDTDIKSIKIEYNYENQDISSVHEYAVEQSADYERTQN